MQGLNLEDLVPGRGDGTVGRLGDDLGLHPVGILLVDNLGKCQGTFNMGSTFHSTGILYKANLINTVKIPKGI